MLTVSFETRDDRLQLLTSIIADSMNVDQVTISLTEQLSMIGVDSLSTVELQLNIERSLGLTISKCL